MLDTATLNRIIGSLPDERLAIAFSGGGDSTALVHICKNLKPKPLVLIVDHALRAGSATEAKQAQKLARSLGLQALILTWDHNNPTTGLQEKARRGRYGFMGQVCRDENIRYLLTGHTQDDQAETLFMRYEKNTGWRGAAGMAEYSYAPVWPELAEVTIVRPLLRVSRDKLRHYNHRNNLTWTEDPSNRDEVFDRVRIRHYLSERPRMSRELLMAAKDLREGIVKEKHYIAQQYEKFVQIDHNGIATVTGPLTSKAWEYLILAAGGKDKPISAKRLERVIEIAKHPTNNGLTLGGARVRREGNVFLVGPDPGPYYGRNNVPAMENVHVQTGQHSVWGGRFNIVSKGAPLNVQTIDNLLKNANTVVEHQRVIKHVGRSKPGKVRFDQTMPYIMDKDGKLLASIFENRDAGYFTCLVENRLQGFVRI